MPMAALGNSRQVNARFDVELVEYVTKVCVDGVRRNEERLREVLARQDGPTVGRLCHAAGPDGVKKIGKLNARCCAIKAAVEKIARTKSLTSISR